MLQWVDRLIRRAPHAAGDCSSLVDGFTRLGGSQYVDSIHNGHYATYVVRDVVGHVDRTYRTIPREGGRAVLGKSSGGFGAMHLVMEHPGIFAAFASHSGDSYFRYAHIPAFATVHRTLEAHDFNLAAFVAGLRAQAQAQRGGVYDDGDARRTRRRTRRAARRRSISICPSIERSGELREDVFARWLAFDPAETGRDASRRAARDCGCAISIAAGATNTGSTSARASSRSASATSGSRVRHEEFDDDHRNVGYRYEISLPALAAALDNE